MREATFVRRYADRWQAFERALDAPDADPDALAQGYIQLTDDLAYAQTYYPGSKTTTYLNGLAGRVHQRVYRTRREDRGRLKRFWTHEIPAIAWAERRHLLAAFLFFSLAFAIGAVSTKYDDTFTRLILGDAYVNMTLDNIDQGDPLAVYKKTGPTDMFLGIALNNVMVSFFAFIGLFPVGSLALPLFTVGTAYALLRNGVMIGTFLFFFYEQGLLVESLLVVFIHGTLEIAAIIIAGGAGFVMGTGLLFPGTLPRLTSFVIAARRGMKLIVGLVPVFIFAAFLEGFVTRQPLPVAGSLLIIGASLAYVLGYFVVYPALRFRNRTEGALGAERAAAEPDEAAGA